MALDVGIELGRRERPLQHVAFELGHVDAVGGEAAKRLVERGRDVAHLEHERCQYRPIIGRWPLGLTGKYDEARRRMRRVLNVLGENIESVNFRREL